MRRESSEVSQLTYRFHPLTFDGSKPLIKFIVVFEALLNSIQHVRYADLHNRCSGNF